MKNIILKLVAVILAVTATLGIVACDTSSGDQSSLHGKDSSSQGASDSSSGGVSDESTEKDLIFVSINDIHGSIEQDENGKNGLSNTAAVIDKMSENYGKVGKDVRDDIILFGNGDMFQGTAISNMSHGRAVIEAMNDMRFDGMGIGNHEFDWGLDTILAYFDGDESNGEANFPLVTANVYKKSEGKYISDIYDDDNVINSTIIEKSGVKVGLIGVIGPLENSILSARIADYSLRKEYVVDRVKEVALDLKADGAEIISLNIHNGDDYNEEFVNLNDNGDYLIDVVFNGHTHSTYKHEITRDDGINVPCVQGGSNNDAFAYIKLTYSTENDTIEYTSSGYRKISNSDYAYDSTVENTIREYRAQLIDSLPVLATSAKTVRNRSDLYDYVGNVMLNAFEADYSCSNTGGIRSTGDITANKDIKEDALYKIVPFDNAMYVIEMQGKGLYKYYTEQGDYNYYGIKDVAKSFYDLKYDENYYTVAIIDYVYTGSYFTPYLDYVKTAVKTDVMLRDLLVEDVRLCGLAGDKWDYNSAPHIGKVNWN